MSSWVFAKVRLAIFNRVTLWSKPASCQGVYQLRTGLAYRSCSFPDGRRAIVDLFAPRKLSVSK
jgi:hypothetical protein